MSADMKTLFTLLIVFHVKHYLADFPLQTKYMLRKVRVGTEWIIPLTVHCLVHAVFTFFICLYYRPELWWLLAVDFLSHFLMDRIKASPNLLGRFNDSKSVAYWSCFGFDQMVHHLAHLFIIWRLMFS